MKLAAPFHAKQELSPMSIGPNGDVFLSVAPLFSPDVMPADQLTFVRHRLTAAISRIVYYKIYRHVNIYL